MLRVALFFVLLPLAAQTNLGFESGSVGQLPPGWFLGDTPNGTGFRAVLVNQGCEQGRQCAMLTGPASAPSGSYGDLGQEVGASGYVGQHIKFGAFVRVAPGSLAQLWLRVDHRDGTYEFHNSPVLTNTVWASSSLEANVTADSIDFYFGILILGGATVWADDASLQSTGTVTELPSQPPSPLSQTGLANLTAFAKLIGEVRHFHPSDEAARVDWNSFVTLALPSIEAASSPEDLAGRLQAAFAPIAPTVRVYTGAAPALAAELTPASRNGLSINRWYNFGFGSGAQSNVYTSYRITTPITGGQLPTGFIDPASPYVADLGNGVMAMVPLSLYVNEQGTMPRGSYPTPATTYVLAASDRTTRLAGVLLAWEVPQNFYPYFDTVQTDWPGALSTALTAAALNAGAADYTATLQRLGAALNDGHVTVIGGPAQSAVPLIWDWVNGELIVSYVWNAQGRGIKAGDRVTSIDGTPVDEALAAKEQLVGAATSQRRLYVALLRLSYCNGSTMQLEIEPYSDARGPNGAAANRTVQMSCSTPQPWTAPRGGPVQQLEPGLFYVDINQLTSVDWAQALPQLAGAQSIVFDLRGYPQTFDFLSKLSDGALSSERFLIPTPVQPDRTNFILDETGEWRITPSPPSLSARRVFLTDASAISAAETVMGLVKFFKLATIVGSPTAGTNGNINYAYLPAGFSMIFTDMKVLMQDGAQFEGIGILPDVRAGRTRAGIAKGIDEVLRRGIEVVKSGQVPVRSVESR